MGFTIPGAGVCAGLMMQKLLVREALIHFKEGGF